MSKTKARKLPRNMKEKDGKLLIKTRVTVSVPHHQQNDIRGWLNDQFPGMTKLIHAQFRAQENGTEPPPGEVDPVLMKAHRGLLVSHEMAVTLHLSKDGTFTMTVGH